MGTTSAEFLKLPAGARGEGMAQAVVGSAEGAEAVFWNPAGLARLSAEEGADLSLNYNRFAEGITSGSASFARPWGKGVWAAGFVYFTQDVQTVYNNTGDSVGSFSPNDMAVSLSYARRTPTWLFGGTVKFLRSDLKDVKGSAGAVDLGVQALQLTDAGEGAVDAGLSIMNLGTPMKAGSRADPLPFLMRAGLVWHTAPFLDSAFDLNLPVDDDPFVAVGFEGFVRLGAQRKWKAFLRAGYNQRYSRGIEGFAGMAAGAGIDLGRLRGDYAWVPFGDLGDTNRFTVAFRF